MLRPVSELLRMPNEATQECEDILTSLKMTVNNVTMKLMLNWIVLLCFFPQNLMSK